MLTNPGYRAYPLTSGAGTKELECRLQRPLLQTSWTSGAWIARPTNPLQYERRNTLPLLRRHRTRPLRIANCAKEQHPTSDHRYRNTIVMMDFFKPGKGGGEDDSPVASTASLIGILVAIAGNVVISFALNLQKLAHKRLEEDSRSGTPTKPPATPPPNVENSFPFEEQPLLPQRGHRSYSQPDATIVVQVPQGRSGFVPRSPTNARIRGQSLNGLAEGTIPEEERTTPEPANHNERVISWFDEEAQPDGQTAAKVTNGAPKNGSENMRFNGSSQETGYLKSKLW